MVDETKKHCLCNDVFTSKFSIIFWLALVDWSFSQVWILGRIKCATGREM